MSKEKFIAIQLIGLGWTNKDMDEVYGNLQADLSLFLRTRIDYVDANAPKTAHVSICEKLDGIHFVKKTTVSVMEDGSSQVKAD
jgi:hypothetical protein